MATFAIGDVHGCWRTLQRLVARVRFDPSHDRMLLVGDLVKKGPGSLEVLRWVRDQGDAATVVLGNHDLEMLARAEGLSGPPGGGSVRSILEAPDRDELLTWLRSRPLLHDEESWVLVHAGLWPGWTLDDARAEAAALSAHLQVSSMRDMLEAFLAEPELPWRPEADEPERLLTAAAALAGIRTVRADGRPCVGFTGPPEKAPDGCRPWFELSPVVGGERTVIFGHWARMGFRRGPGYIALDSGCVYGGCLTAVLIEDGRVFQEPLAD